METNLQVLIGLNDIESEGTYAWVDRSEVNFTKFGGHSPTKDGHQELTGILTNAALNGTSGNWSTQANYWTFNLCARGERGWKRVLSLLFISKFMKV